MRSSSSKDEDRSITGAFLKPPYLNTSEQGRREEISDGDPGGDGDPDGTDGGVFASLGERLPSIEGECERLVRLLSFIGGYQKVREKNPKKVRMMGCEMVISAR
jgi:hypothetical protein